LPGGSYLAKLAAAGFRDAEVVAPTGVETSRFTAAHLIRARR
jgi:hypothetical protein